MSESVDFGALADSYDAARGGAARGNAIEANSTLLEVGIGTGVVAAALQQLGHNIFGADISEEMLSKAAKHIPSVQLT